MSPENAGLTLNRPGETFMSDFDQLRRLATDYFDCLYDGDLPKLESIFHARARLHVILEGKLVEMDMPKYLDVVRNRPSPRSIGAERDDNIIAIIQSSPTTALLIVRVKVAGKAYVDHLALILDEGRWQIISKTYHLLNG
jgi:hypothetical protein